MLARIRLVAITKGSTLGIDMHISGSVNDTCQVDLSKLSGPNINYRVHPEVYGDTVKIQYNALKAAHGY